VSADVSVKREGWSARAWTSPFAVLLVVYVAYLLVVYSRIYTYVSWELMNLGTHIIGFLPSTLTLCLYLYGALTLVFGFLIGRWAAIRIDAASPPSATLVRWVTAVRERLARTWLARRVGGLFAIGLVGWTIAIMANAVVVVAAGGVSLLSIGSRWAQSPTLVLIAATQSFFVPAMLVGARTRRQRVFAVVAFGIGLVALGMLGARNLPAKLLIAAFLSSAYVVKPRNLWRLAVAFLVLLVVAMGIIGAVSKAGIYGVGASAGVAVALTYSDSAGGFSNLDRIVATSPSTGIYNGRLLVDSVRSAIPGVDADYANYILGKYLGGRTYFLINGQRIDRSVSLTSTLIGAPYADAGVLGIAFQMILLGFLLGYLQLRAATHKWAVPFLVLLATYVINGVNNGVHNPHSLIAVAVSVIVVATDAVIGRGGASAPAESGLSVGA
jgi:hypothetical protein